MERKETDAEKEVADKWKDVTRAKEAYNDSILPEGQSSPRKVPVNSKEPVKQPPG